MYVEWDRFTSGLGKVKGYNRVRAANLYYNAKPKLHIWRFWLVHFIANLTWRAARHHCLPRRRPTQGRRQAATVLPAPAADSAS